MNGQKRIFEKNTLHRTRVRALSLALAMLVFTLYLCISLLRLQVGKYEYYREKVYDQITTTAPLRAARGNIYDSEMNILASEKTAWRIFISTRQIRYAMKESGLPYDTQIARGLSSLLEVNEEELLKKIRNTSVLDVTSSMSSII